ncbi:flagellar export chaperone FliS [Paenibacillus sp. GSMTC-2017]|uniref:flagellar export chaperone FliS n=1 Tax=Paenibacillus sp. GSMTC-2017 TaxID=2794350 RepID=UPI0018D93588|nr:flagellar export chaperone FliS [Paenibacillus sp. GSMTC-2017]MBH5320626.1 flagellar export chaperone FliS [Paenibacillus sp. GSMTC-2017]
MQLQQRNKYLETTIQTASPAQLLIMLFDGAIRFCKQGIESIQSNNYADANTNLLKVQNIVKEFMITVDRSSPLSEGLLGVYEYMNKRLIEANIKKEVEPAQEVLDQLIELKETWVQAARQSNQQAGQANGNVLKPNHSVVV